MVTRLPAVAELPEGLENDVRQLRAQISRLGQVNVDALTEYNEVEARYNFLNSQATDLDRAVSDLEQVIEELDAVMRREFVSTFKAIAAQFKDEFTNLFGGGAARLVLTDPEDPSASGVEIIARPPGKREQGLALLSGGERALTAAALIFSILKARPTPFCVLDEVDAALDEANVGRFRDALKSLTKANSVHPDHPQPWHHRGGSHHLRHLDGRRQYVTGALPQAGWPGSGDNRPCGDRLTVMRHRLSLYLMALATVTLWGASFP